MQAEDRAHRVGQKDSVYVQYMVAPGTADDDIWPMIQRKLNVLNSIKLSSDSYVDAEKQVSQTDEFDQHQTLITDSFFNFDTIDSVVDDNRTFVDEPERKRNRQQSEHSCDID